jgi:hypothetical protein
LWNDFTKRFGIDASSGLKFDRVLQYVTLPRVEVILKGVRADRERELELQSGVRQFGPLGRKDMQYFFDWLYAKGVRHIIRVCVEDSGDLGEKVHSDQAIQDCLEKFVIEHLDWKKTDLDPETILHVSSRVERDVPASGGQANTEIVPDRQLKHLCLRWGGSNAVLRAWSEPEGLAMLPHLKKVFLFMPSNEKVRTTSRSITLMFQYLTRKRRTITGHGSAPKSKTLEPDSMQADRLLEHELRIR